MALNFKRFTPLHPKSLSLVGRGVTGFIFRLICLLFALAFVARFGAKEMLRLYIEAGVGNCQKIPILCMSAQDEISNITIDQEFLSGLLPYNFPGIEISLPKNFTAVKEEITKAYYKKKKNVHNEAIAYLLYKEPDFFINLFPKVKKQGINDNYGFVAAVMSARLEEARNLTSAFFVIMKGVFTPDLGGQDNLKMVKFAFSGKRGFINYNLSSTGSWFDCNILGQDDGFFKIYIKDASAGLDLEKVLNIITTLK